MAGPFAGAETEATATLWTVSVFIRGVAYGLGNSASAFSEATLSDTITISGGTGNGILAVTDSVWSYGTGTLVTATDGFIHTEVVNRPFTFGTPFTISLSALASGSFDGFYGDWGSLVVTRSINSVAVLDSTDQPAGAGWTLSDDSGSINSFIGESSTVGGLSIHKAVLIGNTPEPSTWMLGLIGFGLLWVGKAHRSSPNQKSQ